MNIPRLRPGAGFRGPEAFGCCNTGTAPTIRRSLLTGKYLVGTERATEELLPNPMLRTTKRKYQVGPNIVHVCRTRAAALKRFTALCEERRKLNDSLRADYVKERKQYASLYGA